MNLPIILLILSILIGFVLFVMYLPTDTVQYDSEARQAIEMFTKSGEYIGFDRDILAPVTTYIYEPTGKMIDKKLDNGTIISTPELVAVPVEKDSSSVNVNVQDSKTDSIKTCKIGYPCDITGKIVLIDPISEDKIPPPYFYLLTIDCDFRDYCSLIPVGVNESTFGDGSFKYTWVPTDKVTVGIYKVKIEITSHYSNEKGEQIKRIAEQMISVIV